MTETMRAAVWHGPGRQNFRLEAVPFPRIGPGDVLMRVRCVHFCAMHARAVLKGHAKHTPPKIFGRMIAGEVAEVGSDAPKLPTGTRITVNPELACGSCFYCLRQASGHCLQPLNLSPGGMAEFVLVPAPLVANIHPIPDGVPSAFSAFAETLACILQGLQLADVRPGDCVAIVGGGGVGLTFVQLVKKRLAGRIILADRHDDRLERGRRLGAHRTVHVERESLEEAVQKETGGHGADVVIEAVGSGPTYAQALSLARSGGVVVGFGGAPPGASFQGDPNLIHYRSLHVHGSYRYQAEHFRQAVELIHSGAVDLNPIVTHRLPFQEITTRAVDCLNDAACLALVIEHEEVAAK